VSRTLLAAEEMVPATRSPALVPVLLPLDREREPPLPLPRVRLADVRFTAVALLSLEELRLGDFDDPPRDREDRGRRVAAEACGRLPSPPLLAARGAPCVDSESDALPLGPRALRDLASRCVAIS
jgi:hypothetical protein